MPLNLSGFRLTLSICTPLAYRLIDLAPETRPPLLTVSMQARRAEMTKTVRARYTLEFKQEAVRLVQGGPPMSD